MELAIIFLVTLIAAVLIVVNIHLWTRQPPPTPPPPAVPDSTVWIELLRDQQRSQADLLNQTVEKVSTAVSEAVSSAVNATRPVPKDGQAVETPTSGLFFDPYDAPAHPYADPTDASDPDPVDWEKTRVAMLTEGIQGLVQSIQGPRAAQVDEKPTPGPPMPRGTYRPTPGPLQPDVTGEVEP